MDKTFAMGAGETVEFQELSNFARVLEATSTLNIIFYSEGREISRAENVGVGYAENFIISGRTFDKVRLTTVNAQVVHFAMRFGSVVTYDQPPQGNVAISAVVDSLLLPYFESARGRAYTAAILRLQISGNPAGLGLWNPPGSGKTCYVNALRFWNENAANIAASINTISAITGHAVLAGGSYGGNTDASIAPDGVVQRVYNTGATYGITALRAIYNKTLTPGQSEILSFSSPLILPPGFGIFYNLGASDPTLSKAPMNFEYVEK